jgi:hypothetical protein
MRRACEVDRLPRSRTRGGLLPDTRIDDMDLPIACAARSLSSWS